VGPTTLWPGLSAAAVTDFAIGNHAGAAAKSVVWEKFNQAESEVWPVLPQPFFA
jgi:hypothetical protein